VIEMHPARVVLGFDGDTAGQDAAYRHALAVLRRGSEAAVAVLPAEHDPASWLAERGDDGLAVWRWRRTRGIDAEGPGPIPADIYIALGLAAQAARSRSKHPGEGQFRRAEYGVSIATLRSVADESPVAL
jgi:hypothetical protein